MLRVTCDNFPGKRWWKGQHGDAHPNSTTSPLHRMSLETVTFIAVTRTAGLVVTSKKIIFTWLQAFTWYQVHRKSLSSWRNRSQVKNTVTKYISWGVKPFHSSQEVCQTFMGSTHKKRCQHKDQGKRNSAGYRAKAGLFQGGSASGDAFLLIGKVLPSQNYKRRGWGICCLSSHNVLSQLPAQYNN